MATSWDEAKERILSEPSDCPHAPARMVCGGCGKERAMSHHGTVPCSCGSTVTKTESLLGVVTPPE